MSAETQKVDVLAVMRRADDFYARVEGNDTNGLGGAIEAVTELIDQRDALVGVVFGLVQSLPKGSRSLSSAAQAYMKDATTLACSIFDRADVDPEAFSRYSKSLWGCEYRAKPDALRERYAAALARVGGAA